MLTNVAWYSDRFDMYHEVYFYYATSFFQIFPLTYLHKQAIVNKLLRLPAFIGQLLLPAHLSDLFAFIDGTVHEICRPDGAPHIHNAFWNGYYHGHFFVWMGITFPDGMIVLEGPLPGFNTDTVAWRNSQLRIIIENLMGARVLQGLPRLKLYGDKIYNTCAIITAAWNARYGPVLQWMTNENAIMSKVRIAIEWTFETLKKLRKFMTFFKAQKMQESPTIEKHMVISALMSNCHCCLYGDRHNEVKAFDIDPPTLEDYLGQ